MMKNIKASALGKKPDRFLFIIGAMKCGTTSLFDILSQHPEICPSKIKEPGYFDAERDGVSFENYLENWDWSNATHKYALESSTTYTQYPNIKGVPERMALTNLGEYRFIYLMRNPLKRIESQVRHRLFAGWGKSLDDGIQNDLIDFSRYAMQMDEFLKYFSKETLLPIVLEDFKMHPHQELKKICEFLKIDENFKFTDVDQPRNSGEFFSSPSIIRQLSQSKLGTLVIRKILPFRFKNWLRYRLTKIGKNRKNSQNIGRWKLTDDEKDEILKSLTPDLSKLKSVYSVDVYKAWKIPSEL